MSEEVYQVVAQVMRYWFAALSVVIVLRAFHWLRKDRRARHRMLRSLPDAGMVGEWLVENGSSELPAGVVVPVPREGVLGSIRSDDIYIPVGGVTHRHLFFEFVPKKGLRIIPAFRQVCEVNGTPVTWRSIRKKPIYLHHGDAVCIGDAVLRLRVFMGLESAYHPRFVDEEEPAPSPIAYGPSAGTQIPNPAGNANPSRGYEGATYGVQYPQSGGWTEEDALYAARPPMVSEEDVMYGAPVPDPAAPGLPQHQGPALPPVPQVPASPAPPAQGPAAQPPADSAPRKTRRRRGSERKGAK